MITTPWFVPIIQPIAPGRVKVIHASHDQMFLAAGYSVATIRTSLQEVFNISPEAKALINGVEVGRDRRLAAGDVLEFVRRFGWKAGFEPEELARLERIERRLNHIEAQMPTLASLSEAVVRVADHLAPPAASIVGSKYVADRLGCTTAWVGRMAFKGIIPRKSIVPGTGGGRLWKFYRQQVDDWLASRSLNGT